MKLQTHSNSNQKAEIVFSDLPVEQDRKRFLGCLAAVLAKTHLLEEQNANTDTSTGTDSSVAKSWRKNANTDTTTTESSVAKSWRRRRYVVMSKLLKSSAVALMLEAEQASAFLPMLDKLLEDTPRPLPPESDLNDAICHQIDQIDGLKPFLEAMSYKTAFQCLCLLMIQHLLQSADQGYDARMRHAQKTLGVILFMRQDQTEKESTTDALTKATRKFESLEHLIGAHLILLSLKAKSELQTDKPKAKQQSQLIRNLKIGGAAVAAGGLFAITGGLAAPGIAAGIAALAGGTVISAAAGTILASSVAVTTIFGVGGGSLAAYKMSRRVQGLTEFQIQRETAETTGPTIQPNAQQNDGITTEKVNAELFSTIAVSGWLNDSCDFQRPWGVTPSNPPLSDLNEILERFYAIYCPEYLPDIANHLQLFKDRENELWGLLEATYGRNPQKPFPIAGKSRRGLEVEEETVVRNLFRDLGSTVKDEHSHKASFRTREHPLANIPGARSQQYEEYEPPKHLATAWDYQTTYGGDLYTVKIESSLIKELSGSVNNFIYDFVRKEGTKRILQYTAMATLMSAIALPATIAGAANMIDGIWVMACERFDEAGVELARSLLYTIGGSRPVTLVGFSFGARTIFSCLLELARYQKLWESYHAGKQKAETRPKRSTEDDDFDKMREPASIVEDVIIMGLPQRSKIAEWEDCRQVVAGRLVNCFSQKDIVLSIMFRAQRLVLKPVCGVCPVAARGVENIDVTDLISSHQEYCLKAGDILKRVRHGEPFCSISTSYDSVIGEAEASVPTEFLDPKDRKNFSL